MSQPWNIWREAAGREAVDAGLRLIYEQLGSEIAARSPTCWLSGKCCHFNAYGHRLYVTGLEIAWCLKQLEQAEPARLQATRAVPMDLAAPCVFQVNKLCSVHAIRPLGCRLFFCQQGTEHWQHELYEEFLGRLKRLHEAHELPYAYMEWRAGLSEAMQEW